MSKYLVIIESPGKIKSYQKYLDGNYEVISCVGHCIDLPEDSFAVDLKNDFATTLEVKPDHIDILKSIKTASKNKDTVFLCTDLDREGEGISFNLYNEIKNDTKAKFKRAVTSEITQSGILSAIKNAGEIDQNKVNAFWCRRILDRICGYKTSFLTQQATGGRSAGRVQSAILRIIVDRELEIKNFIPKEYWVLLASFCAKNGNYQGKLTDKIEVPNEATATKIYNEIIGATPEITSVESKLINSNPNAPFTTLPLIAAASSILGWNAKKTMGVAQELYNSGLQTYHRSDSPNISQDALDQLRNFVKTNYPQNYLSQAPKNYQAKKGAQEAHECIRPTNVQNTPSSVHLESDQQKLYELVWKRSVACQMSEGKDKNTKIITTVNNYDFITTGSVEVFDGHRKVWDYSNAKDTVLPEVEKGEHPKLTKLDKEQKFTTPPQRYSDASLSKKCEADQIARPATFHNFLETLKSRNYITAKNKSFEATDLGIKVVQFLKDADMCFIDLKFTSRMEDLLDEIQENKKTKLEVLTEFWNRLQADIKRGNEVKAKSQLSGFKCPKCNGNLLKKHSKFGAFFSCENYKKASKKTEKVEFSCGYIAQVGPDGTPIEKVIKPKEYASFNCKNCDKQMIKRSSAKGEFYGCAGFPKCRTTASLDGVFSEPKKTKYKKYNKKKSAPNE